MIDPYSRLLKNQYNPSRLSNPILFPHDTKSDIEFWYRNVKSAVYAQHLHIILLVKKGFSTEDIADITTVSPRWIYSICDRYNKGGKDALKDQRETNPGQPPRLSENDMEEIKKNFRSLPLMAAFGQEPKLQS